MYIPTNIHTGTRTNVKLRDTHVRIHTRIYELNTNIYTRKMIPTCKPEETRSIPHALAHLQTHSGRYAHILSHTNNVSHTDKSDTLSRPTYMPIEPGR